MPSRIFSWIAAIVAALAAILALANLDAKFGDPTGALADFPAFYCTGATSHDGRDPYRSEPLGACERRVTPEKLPAQSDFVIPAPLPPFAIAFFRALDIFDYGTAGAIWIVLLAINFFVLFRLCARLVPGQELVTLLALIPLGLLQPLKLGQPVPFAISFALGCALALRGRRFALAGALAAGSLVEPHIGMPVCIAVALWRPRTTVAMLGTIGVLALVSIASVGVATSVEYARDVLGAHVLSELDLNDQLSTAYLLRWIGASAPAALAVGYAAYWIVSGLAIAFARKASPAMLVFLPMAAAVTAGPYLHAEHLLAAVPLGLLALSQSAPRVTRALAGIALFFVAAPLRWSLLLLGLLPPTAPYYLGRLPEAMHGPNVLASVAWSAIVEGQRWDPAYLWIKIPTWIGLLAIVALAAYTAQAPQAPERAAPASTP